jgi:hypothetical protein
MPKLNIKPIPTMADKLISEEKNDRLSRRRERLVNLGVQLSLYVSPNTGFKFPEHPDGIHNYINDTELAEKLVDDNKEFPEDLVQRFKYYKEYFDKID